MVMPSLRTLVHTRDRWSRTCIVSAGVVGSLLLAFVRGAGQDAPENGASRVVVTDVGVPGTDRGIDVTSRPQTPGRFARGLDLSAYAVVAKPAGSDLPWGPGRVVVKYRSGVGAVARLSAMTGAGATSAERPSYANFEVLRISPDENPEAVAAALAERPDVEYAQASYRVHASFTPNDPFFGEQWNMAALDMPRAWDINQGASPTVTIAILDTGVAWRDQTISVTSVPMQAPDGTIGQFRFDIPFGAAPDLAGPDRFVAPHDFNWGDNNPADWDGHGTHVTGSAGQLTNNGIGVSGMAFNTRIMPVKVLTSAIEDTCFTPPTPATDETVARGIRYAVDNRAQVLNMSLGRSGGPPAPVMEDALRYAVSRGAFVAIAAGNSFEDGNPIEWPASYGPEIDGVVTVGALGRELNRSFFSNTGFVEISAPGGDQRSGGTTGGILQQTYDRDAASTFPPRFDIFRYRYFQGTSMASSHVAGFAALLYQQGINNPAAIEAAMKTNARDIGAAGEDLDTGFGFIQPRPTLLGLGLAQPQP